MKPWLTCGHGSFFIGPGVPDRFKSSMNHPIIGGVNSDPDMLTIENVIIKIILNQGLMMSLFEEICKKPVY